MTEVQGKNETDSIESFVVKVTKVTRRRDTSAASTCVIMAAARAAADMAQRNEDGSIDDGAATLILNRAAQLLHEMSNAVLGKKDIR